MFREATEYQVYPLGYEHIAPILRQYRDHPNQEHRDIINKVLDNYDSSPDFLLTNRDKSDIYLIEVKYRNWTEIKPDEVLKIVAEINERWKSVGLWILCRKEL